jgi:hypothetical protein
VPEAARKAANRIASTEAGEKSVGHKMRSSLYML